MKYTLCFIFSPDLEKTLMIRKIKGPHPGYLNGIGGKIEDFDINPITSALREIKEETGLNSDDIEPLRYLVKLSYPNTNNELNVFYTKQTVFGKHPHQMEDEKLIWYKTKSLLDINNPNLAGDGDIPYFIKFALNCEQAW